MIKIYDIILSCKDSPWSKYKTVEQKSAHIITKSLCKSVLSVVVVYSIRLQTKDKLTLVADDKKMVQNASQRILGEPSWKQWGLNYVEKVFRWYQNH